MGKSKDRREAVIWPSPVKIWLERVDYDLETAQAMYKAGRYLYVVFMCQQAVEKKIKALLALQGKEVKPIHHLSKLAEFAGIIEEFDEQTLALVENLSAYYLNARYKETIAVLTKAIGKNEAKDYLAKSQKVIAWLTQKMKQSV
jgi:HEPN domain-containing protein